MNYLFLAILVVIFSSVFSFASGVIIFLIIRFEVIHKYQQVSVRVKTLARDNAKIREENKFFKQFNIKLSDDLEKMSNKVSEIKEWIDSGGKPPKKPAIVTSMTGFRDKSEQRYIDQMKEKNKQYPAVVRQ